MVRKKSGIYCKPEREENMAKYCESGGCSLSGAFHWLENAVFHCRASHGYALLFSCRRAFVFSLDMLIAAFVVILLMTAANKHVINSEQNQISNIQMSAIASDIIFILDHNSVLQTLDENKISSDMADLLPLTYSMSIRIVLDDSNTLYIGSYPPANQFVVSGTRFFVLSDSDSFRNYAYAHYSIWAKQIG